MVTGDKRPGATGESFGDGDGSVSWLSVLNCYHSGCEKRNESRHGSESAENALQRTHAENPHH
jgi:hypothetical protein